MSTQLPTRKDPDVIPLRLPDIPHEGQPGARFVRRAVGLTLMLIAALAVAGVGVAFLVKMDVTVKAAGVLEPVGLYPIRALQGGPVREVLVHTGDTVHRGQVLVRMDTVELASSLAQLQAQLRAAEIDRQRSATADPLQREQSSERVAQARTRLGSSLATLRQRMVEYDLGTNVDSLLAAYVPGTHVTLDQAVAEVRSAQADIRLSGAEGGLQELSRFDREKLGTQMDQLRAQIAAIRARLGQLTIAAPTDGVVLTEQLERLPGAFVREGEQLMELGDTQEWRVQLSVAERDVHKVKVGDSVKVELPAFDQSERQQLGGRVIYVAPEPLSAQGQAAGGASAPVAQAGPGVYRVTASLDRRQLEKMGIENFRRGYTVQGNVITRSGRIITLLWNYLTEKLGQ
ncbi:HlyD family secretion protein [Longimicrobium sp.]|uniref:HlyD family secretion protein n=1 Tax=Longimicrobium sp. TaxID=2029185 RepID=UPI002BBE5E34|nr:efflux RND transporter periplasmic adaptor subunit [Longimicrobium sp.]HSU13174.1 efflux RND transporter periplasmic adaptor subunit [Longimicrobium sp.]